ncbi:MAG: DUF2236 domain-containing protein [Chloroflexi bacterium]|nr:MAG: DUF2236 domain-containing protein [Chloroflexota bacterium]
MSIEPRRPDALEPLARTFVRCVPEHPADDGLFGPRSVVWRVHRDRSFLVAGVRSLMIQALHPLPMAGVAEHSDWQRDPFGRLAATSGYVLTITYGERAAALGAAAWVRDVHTLVHGVDPVTGLAYSAEDPALLLWIHAAMVDSIVAITQAYGRGLDAADADAYVAEMVRFASILGVPEEVIPHDVGALARYLTSVDIVQATPAAHEAMAIVLDPPGLDEDTRELWHDVGRVAIGTLPEWARDLYGWEAPPAEELEREPVRQLIGVLDFAFESLPGVLEARRRIELRMRAA